MIQANYTETTSGLFSKPPYEELRQPSANCKFNASTSLSEKISRVFNAAMFIALGVQIAGYLPSAAALNSGLLAICATLLKGTLLLQNPVALAIIGIAAQVIVLVPLLMVVRKILSVVISHRVYPAAITSYNVKFDDERQMAAESLETAGFEFHRFALHKSGVDYDAFLVTHEDSRDNGQWVQVAGGNCWVGEDALRGNLPYKFNNLGFNILYINGPGVARSSGFPTRYSMGAGQEAGMQFLEQIIKAKKILMYGASLGGGAQAEAIINHDFSYAKEHHIEYLVWSDRTFDLLSNAASAMVSNILKPLFFFADVELDGIASARKLKAMHITQIVTQNNMSRDENNSGSLPYEGEIVENDDDGVIPNEASLYVGLRKNGITDAERIKFYGSECVDHNGDLPSHIEELVNADIKNFLKVTV